MKTNQNSALRPAWIRHVALVMVACVGLNTLAPVALAGPISSATMVAGSTRTADLASIRLALELGAEPRARFDHTLEFILQARSAAPLSGP